MRLINTTTGEFADFVDSSTAPFYAILSHTWARPPDREQSYQEVVEIQKEFRDSTPLDGEAPSDSPLSNITPQPDALAASQPHIPTESTLSALLRSLLISILARTLLYGLFISLFPQKPERHNEVQTPRPSPRRSIWDPDSGLSKKVRKACEIARLDGYQYIWVDSSCIDKTSSSELSEAINSMFKWYRDAQICYAFLADVPSSDDVRRKNSEFRDSRWFKRSWTLQELIAPLTVVFLSKDWKGLGTKDSLANVVEEITHIGRDILTHKKVFADESVAERMRWAAEREATRVEDEAYSLLGIFGITMPTLYGEGRHAFQRLQEEILQRIPDRTLFAWGECRQFQPSRPGSVKAWDVTASPLASSPQSFRRFWGKIRRLSQGDFDFLGLHAEEYTLTPHGIRAKLSFLPLKVLTPDVNGSTNSITDSLYLYLVLGSQQVDDRRCLLGKLCSITRIDGDIELLHVSGSESLTVSPDDLVGAHGLQLRSVYLSYPTPSIAERRPAPSHLLTPALLISLSPWAKDVLPPGYTIWTDAPTESPLRNSSLHVMLERRRNNSFGIVHIQFRHMLDGQTTILEARIWILPPSGPDGTVQRDTLLLSQNSPPYTSVIWFVCPRESPPPLTPRDVHFITPAPSRDEVALRLWLGFGAPSHCNVHVEVVTYVPSSSRELSTRAQAVLEGRPHRAMDTPHAQLKFTILGSVLGALEAQGYSVRLEQPDSGDSDDSHHLSLIISKRDLQAPKSAFTIFIRFSQMLYQDPGKQCLVVVARVTLESVLGGGPDSDRFEDGPYIACWSDNPNGGWHWCLARKDVSVITPSGALLRLRLGLDLAWQSEYYLVVDIEDGGYPSRDCPPNLPVEKPHGHHITLTLPRHIRRALQVDGYEVHFERQGEDRSNPYYHLTLSNADVAIDIKYFHHVSTGSGGQKRLTLQACIATPSLHGSPDAATQSSGTGRIVDWDARGSESRTWTGSVWEPGGWYWVPQQEDVALAFSTGTELTLRLGLYLVSPYEYCLTVAVNPPTLVALLPSSGV